MKYLRRSKVIILLITIFAISIYYFKFVNTKVLTKDNHNNTDFSNFKGLNMEKATVRLKYENNDLVSSLPIYVERSRYYIPINEVISKIGGKIKIDKDKVYLNLDKTDITVSVKDSSFEKEGKYNKLKKGAIITDNILYMSMFDFIKMFNLKTYWDYPSNTICFYKNRDNIVYHKAENEGKMALIRLEDITSGGGYASSEALEKLRIVADYLYRESIPFHVAWVPRYINPPLKIDNDPSEKFSIYNSDFIFTMDYFWDKNGVIGLHGYTHQYGDSESVDGIEFHRSKNDGIPADKEYAQDRIDKAINTAKKLDIKYEFFEVPHYAILPPQLEVVEKNFDYIYEPYSTDGGINEYKEILKKNNKGKNTTYVPTPLNYIDGKKDCATMLNRIDTINEDTLASFFYHPYIEFDDIKTYRDKDGYPCYEYSNKSVLHQVLNKFKEKKYKFIKINEIN